MPTVNHCSCREIRQFVASGLLICAALGALALPTQAHAQLTGNASATTKFESNSNVFDLDSGQTSLGTDGPRRADTDYSYGANLAGNYQFGQQQIYATASTTENKYQHFVQLNHNDYSLGGGLNWKFEQLLDGGFDVTRTHSMVPFENLSGSVLALSVATSQSETARIGLKVGSDWKIEGSASTSKTDQPIPQAPNLQSTQTSGTASLDYQGFGPVTSGLTAEYLSGDYGGSNSGLDSTYTQRTVGLLANYKLSRTSFDGQVGYSSRASRTGIDNASGLTGSIVFKDQLTAKTNFAVKIDRIINSYLPTLGSEVDSDASVSISWQATYKTTVSLGYSFTYRDYPPQAGQAQGSNRVDYQQSANLGISYQPVSWLLISPYANIQTRNSNMIGGDFHGTIVGVSLTATTPDSRRGR